MKSKLTPINITNELKEILLESFKWTNIGEYGKTLLFLLNESPTFLKVKKKFEEDKEFIKNEMKKEDVK